MTNLPSRIHLFEAYSVLCLLDRRIDVTELPAGPAASRLIHKFTEQMVAMNLSVTWGVVLLDRGRTPAERTSALADLAFQALCDGRMAEQQKRMGLDAPRKVKSEHYRRIKLLKRICLHWTPRLSALLNIKLMLDLPEAYVEEVQDPDYRPEAAIPGEVFRERIRLEYMRELTRCFPEFLSPSDQLIVSTLLSGGIPPDGHSRPAPLSPAEFRKGGGLPPAA